MLGARAGGAARLRAPQEGRVFADNVVRKELQRATTVVGCGAAGSKGRVAKDSSEEPPSSAQRRPLEGGPAVAPARARARAPQLRDGSGGRHHGLTMATVRPTDIGMTARVRHARRRAACILRAKNAIIRHPAAAMRVVLRLGLGGVWGQPRPVGVGRHAERSPRLHAWSSRLSVLQSGAHRRRQNARDRRIRCFVQGDHGGAS